MKILISGSTGYIARHLVSRLLELEHTVYIVTREDTDFVKIDARIAKENIIAWGDIKALYRDIETLAPDMFIHMSSYYKFECIGMEIEKLIDANIKYGTVILDACRKAKCKRIINIGSILQHYNGEVYNPTCLYAATKEAFQKIIDYYVQTEECSSITLELMDTFGEEDTRGKIISLFMKIAETGERLEMSGGEQEIGLVYIGDVIKAICKAISELDKIEDGKKKMYVVAPNKYITLKHVASLFEEVSGKYLNIDWGKRSYRKKEIMKIIAPYENILEGEEIVSVKDGLKKILELDKLKRDTEVLI